MQAIKRAAAVIMIIIFTSLFGCSGSQSTSQTTGSGTSKESAGKRTGKVLTEDMRLTTDPTDQSSPAIAYDTVNNKYLTVWTDLRKSASSPGNFDVWGRICSGAGTGTATTLTCDAEFPIIEAAGAQAEPKVAFAPGITGRSARYLVTWTDSSSGVSQIKGQFVSTSGQLITAAAAETVGTQVIDITSLADPAYFAQSKSDLIYVPQKDVFVAAWVDKSTVDTPDNPLNSIVVSGAGCANSSSARSYIPLPLVDYNLVRSAEISPANGAVSNKQDLSPLSLAGSSDTGAAVVVSFTVAKNEDAPRLTADAGTGKYYVAWNEMVFTVNLTIPYAKGTAPPGGLPPCSYGGSSFSSTLSSRPPVRICNLEESLLNCTSLGTAAALYPTLATDPNNHRVLIAWEDNQQILGQLLDTSLNPYANPINISPKAGSSDPRTSPVAAFDNVQQRFLVTWEDARNQSSNISNIDIYGQFIDPTGNLSGGNTIVTVAQSNQLAPAVSFGDSDFRQFMVAFADGRNPGNKDIFAQLLEFSTLPQLSINDASDTPILSGSIDFGNVNIGDSRDIDLKIRNDGNTQLTIQNASLPDSPYSFITPTPVTISPGTSITVTVRFAPFAAGSYAGTASNNFKTVFTSNGGNATIYFNGNGVGADVPLVIDTTALADVQSTTQVSTKLVAHGGVFPYTWSSTTLPAGLVLDPATGLLSGSVAASGTYPITFFVTDSSATPVTAQRTLTLNVGVITIADITLKEWTEGQEYNSIPFQQMSATGGVEPFTWDITAGNPPTGIDIGPTTGRFTGVPTASGTFNFTVTVTDSLGQSATKDVSITINPPLAIFTTALSSGVVGAAYSQTVQVTGGTNPTTMTITSGALPPGLIFDSGTGLVSGTPTASGTYPFTVRVVDVASATATQNLSIVIAPAATTGGGGTGFPPPSGPDNPSTGGGGGGGGCFIATAAYGSYLDPHVMVLRHFRDNVLLQSEAGTAFVRFYYKHSPPVADFIARHESLRLLMRLALTPLIFAVKYPLVSGLFLIAGLARAIARRFRVKSIAAEQAG